MPACLVCGDDDVMEVDDRGRTWHSDVTWCWNWPGQCVFVRNHFNIPDVVPARDAIEPEGTQ